MNPAHYKSSWAVSFQPQEWIDACLFQSSWLSDHWLSGRYTAVILDSLTFLMKLAEATMEQKHLKMEDAKFCISS